MNRQQSMKKCAAIKRATPLAERRKVERMGRKGAAERKRSPEFAAQWAEAERTSGCHEQRYRGSHSRDLQSGR